MNPTGITLYDAQNGSAYCFRVYGGQSLTIPGECSASIDLGQSTVVGGGGSGSGTGSTGTTTPPVDSSASSTPPTSGDGSASSTPEINS